MSITNPVLWEQPLGYAADANEIPLENVAGSNAASFQMIFPVVTEQPIAAGGIPPARADFNGLFKLLGENIYFLQRGGFYQYDANVTYEQGAIVLYGNLLYQSLAGDNKGNTPGEPASTSFWSEFIHHPDLSDYAKKSAGNIFTADNAFTAKVTVSGSLQIGAEGTGGTSEIATVNGYITGTTAPKTDRSTKFATTAFVGNVLADYPASGNLVTLDGTQSISGAKTFTAKITASGGIQGNLTGNVTGDVTGDVNGDVSGNAATATKLATGRTIRTNLASSTAVSFDGSANITSGVTGILPVANGGTGRNDGKAAALVTARTITLTGDASGSTTFDGSANRSITLTLDASGVTAAAYGPSANATLKHSGTFTVPQVTVDAKGRVTAAATRTYTLPADSNTDTKVTQTVTTTNDDFPVLTTALADASANRTEGVRFDTKVKVNHSTGTVTAPKFNGPSTSCTGNAATATKWSAKRTITLGGDLSGSVSLDGSANVTLNATVKDTGGAVPVGAIIPYFGQGSVPSGYLLCNGAKVSRTTYANLFKAIGTKFGTGDGSTTFTLPNCNGRYLQGTTGTPGAAIEAGLPDIQGWAAWPWMGQNNNGDYSGCFYYSQHGNEANNQGAYAGLTGLGFSASRSSSVYSGSSVTPASYGVQYLIKY